MAAGTGFTLTGIAEMSAKLKKLGSEGSQTILKAAAKSLYESCETVMTESKEVYCPVDKGNLRASGRVDLPKIEGQKITVTMAYGGPTAPYAIFVHEINKNYHNGKQWKYLETPLKAAIPAIDNKLADDVDVALRNL